MNWFKKKTILDNAIDNRDMAVRQMVRALSGAVGSSSDALAKLVIWIEVDSEQYDPMKYAWADDRFLKDLRYALDNALLSSVGADSIDLKFATAVDIDRSAVWPVVENALYYSWGGEKEVKPQPTGSTVKIALTEGTGSLQQKKYILDPQKNLFHIGRGAVASRDGVIRRNDIVIRDDETDESLKKLNGCVSGSHADIIVRSGRFYLRACPGGCRGQGGASTKIIHGDDVEELTDVSVLHPLSDGDFIQLGKTVTLEFWLSKE